jgi:ribosomal-protein-alanine N-acetyltransferase
VDNRVDEITVEALTPAHFASVLKIEKAVFKDPWPAAAFLEVMSFSANCWAAMANGQVVGYLITQWVLDEIHILNVAVSPEMHRAGIGSKLLNFVVAEGQKQGMRDMFLEVRVSNVAAISLYMRFGFQVLSTRKKYYTDGEDALVMHCPVPENTTGTGKSVDTAGSKTEEK